VTVIDGEQMPGVKNAERAIVNAPGRAWARWRVPLGYPLAVICLWLARPTAQSVIVGAAVALVGLLVRATAAGHLRKSQALANAGPYARTRNPLYLGSSLLAAAFVAASRSWIVAALLGAYFLAFYPRVMRREETELRTQYGEAFEEYARRVPLFWPRLRADGAEGGSQFSFAQYRRNREYQAAIGVAVILAMLGALAAWRR
jgi:protein-S-isoprenylcysteine O-methyltransferase Ste14